MTQTNHNSENPSGNPSDNSLGTPHENPPGNLTENHPENDDAGSAGTSNQSQSDEVSHGDAQLTAFRRSIDNIDAALVYMLAERFRITQAVGEYKAKTDLPPADPGREEEQVERLRNLAIEAQLDPEFSEQFLRFIIEEVIRHHQKAREG